MGQVERHLSHSSEFVMRPLWFRPRTFFLDFPKIEKLMFVNKLFVFGFRVRDLS